MIGEHLAQPGPRDRQPLRLVVGTGPVGGGALADVAIEGHVHLQGFDLEAAGVQGIEDVVGIEGPVIVPDAGMIAADHQVGTAEVLPEQGVQQGLARTGIAHLDGIAGLDDGIGREVVLHQGIDRLGPNLGRDIAGLELAQDLVDQQAVANLDGDLGQILVAAVHGVPGLEGRHPRPTPFREKGAGLGRAQVQALEVLRIGALAQHPHRSAQVDLALGHHLGDPGMRGVGGSKDPGTFQLPVDGVFFRDLHDRHDLVRLSLDQGHLLARRDRLGQVPIAG